MILKAGTMLQDRYEILEKIGSGGMSDVYKAKCHKLNRLEMCIRDSSMIAFSFFFPHDTPEVDRSEYPVWGF